MCFNFKIAEITNAYTLNAYLASSASVYTFEYTILIPMFKTLEASSLRKFLEVLAIIFKTHLLDFYAKALLSEDGNVTYSHGDKTIIIDESLLASTFSLPTIGVVDFSAITKKDMAVVLKSFSASWEDIFLSCFKKMLKMEFHVLADIVTRCSGQGWNFWSNDQG